jgi:predicted MPP superfamily phosphohydrolase
MPNLHIFPDGILLVVSLAAQAGLSAALIRTPIFGATRTRRLILAAGSLLVSAIYLAGYLSISDRVARHFPLSAAAWTQATALILAMASTGICVSLGIVALLKRIGLGMEADPRRRALMRFACGAALASPVVATGFGILRRNEIGLKETVIEIPGLPADLNGLRIAQLTDIHLSAFLAESDLARAVDMINSLQPQITLVTGDLITRRGDPLDACLKQIRRFRADAGVLGCLGNHEIYTQTENYVTVQCARMGIGILRMQNRLLRFGGAKVNFGGVDYQKMHEAYLAGAGELIEPGALNILLSHNPDVFPVAVRQGWDLTIAGHTHGGQVNVEVLDSNINLARFFTPYTRGLYWLEGSAAFVSAGIGTVGMPVRLGAPPEVNLLTLRASGAPKRVAGARA